MKIKIDSHLHPHLPKTKILAERKAKIWWKTIKKHGINCIISTEHAYHNPEYNYEVMKKFEPKECIVFPGCELITEEGIDIVIFDKNPDFFKNEKLMKPYSMKIEKLLDYLEKIKIPYYIPHPFGPAIAALFVGLEKKRAEKIIKRAKGIEAQNCAFSGTMRATDFTRMTYLLKNNYKMCKKSEKVSEKYLDNAEFITTGSDAHSPFGVGSYGIIDSVSKDPEDIFNAIITNKKREHHKEDKIKIHADIVGLKAASDDAQQKNRTKKKVIRQKKKDIRKKKVTEKKNKTIRKHNKSVIKTQKKKARVKKKQANKKKRVEKIKKTKENTKKLISNTRKNTGKIIKSTRKRIVSTAKVSIKGTTKAIKALDPIKNAKVVTKAIKKRKK